MEEAKSKRVKIVYANDDNESPLPEELARLVGADEKLIPAVESIAFGKFNRDGREIYMMTNTDNQSYAGKLTVQKGKRYIELDPQTGKIADEQKIADHTIPIRLDALQARLFVLN